MMVNVVGVDAKDVRLISIEESLEKLEDSFAKLSRQMEQTKKDIDELKRGLYDTRDLAKYTLQSHCKRLSTLEDCKSNAQPKQKTQYELLRVLLAANNGKMLAIDARHKLGMSKSAFSLLLRTMGDKVELKALHTDRRKKLIVLK